MGVTPPPVTACCFDSLLFLLFKTASCDHGYGGVTPTRQRSGCRHCFGTRGQARDHRRPRTIPSRSRFVRTAACVDMPSGCAGASTISVLWFRAWFRVSNTRFGGSAAFDFSSHNMITSQNDNANGQTVGALGAARGYKNPSATPSIGPIVFRCSRGYGSASAAAGCGIGLIEETCAPLYQSDPSMLGSRLPQQLFGAGATAGPS